MKVRINIDKSVALDAGKDRHGPAVVDVPAGEFSAAERAILKERADAPSYSVLGSHGKEPAADFYLDKGIAPAGGGTYVNDHNRVPTEATADAVHAVLAKIAEVEAVHAAAKAAAKAAEDAKREARIVALAAGPVDDLIEYTSYYDAGRRSYLNVWLRSDPVDPRIEARRAEVQAECDRRNDADMKEHAKAQVEKEAAEAKKEAAKEKAEAERHAWVEAHGSDHLKKACKAGYNCQRKYVTERTALEFPGFTADFDDLAEWKERTCPNEEALDLLDGLPDGTDASIVWLTHPAYATDDEDAYFEKDCWQAREAIVVREYLGKYDLVREMDPE